ncbi:MAG TPA: dimethylsulfoniopropionate lyase [Aliidongia sp.]|nr:dimethylsulfoniopropionate lyase [Aliidongia sp.]
MIHRSAGLQQFIDAAFNGFDLCAGIPASRRSIANILRALETPAPEATGPGERLPVCSHLEQALEVRPSSPVLLDLVTAFRTIEPSLQWRRRTSNASASDNFSDGHANAMIVGPGGLEDRRDAWLGVTLMAPNVRYPDHDHAPEETYLILSEGEFRHGDTSWFTPGIGGSFYNPPGIRHAMRSGDRPLFAFWALWAGGPA